MESKQGRHRGARIADIRLFAEPDQNEKRAPTCSTTVGSILFAQWEALRHGKAARPPHKWNRIKLAAGVVRHHVLATLERDLRRQRPPTPLTAQARRAPCKVSTIRSLPVANGKPRGRVASSFAFAKERQSILPTRATGVSKELDLEGQTFLAWPARCRSTQLGFLANNFDGGRAKSTCASSAVLWICVIDPCCPASPAICLALPSAG